MSLQTENKLKIRFSLFHIINFIIILYFCFEFYDFYAASYLFSKNHMAVPIILMFWIAYRLIDRGTWRAYISSMGKKYPDSEYELYWLESENGRTRLEKDLKSKINKLRDGKQTEKSPR